MCHPYTHTTSLGSRLLVVQIRSPKTSEETADKLHCFPVYRHEIHLKSLGLSYTMCINDEHGSFRRRLTYGSNLANQSLLCLIHCIAQTQWKYNNGLLLLFFFLVFFYDLTFYGKNIHPFFIRQVASINQVRELNSML